MKKASTKEERQRLYRRAQKVYGIRDKYIANIGKNLVAKGDKNVSDATQIAGYGFGGQAANRKVSQNIYMGIGGVG